MPAHVALIWCLVLVGIVLGVIGLMRCVVLFLTEDLRTFVIRVSIVIVPIVMVAALCSPWMGPSVLVVVVFMGLVPMVIYTTLLWWIDHWEREPWHLIAGAFLWGAVPAIVLALIAESTLEGILSTGAYYGSLESMFTMAVVVAPPVEESVKALALLWFFVLMREQIDSILDGLIYGAAIGFGFAAVENIFYFLEPAMYGGPPALFVVAFYRAFVFGMAHSFFTGMTGLGFGLGRFRTSWFDRIAFPLGGLLLAILLHSFFNWTAFDAMLDPWGGRFHIVQLAVIHGMGIAGVAVFILISLLVQRAWVRRYLREEVERGVLTQTQAQAASSIVRSWTACGLERRLNQLCAKLAMLHHAAALAGQRGASIVQIETLRKRVSRLSRRLCDLHV